MATSDFFVYAVIYEEVTLVGVCAGEDTKPVYFSMIISGGEYGYNSSGGIPSIDIALEAVQRRQLLPGYKLTYDRIRNSKVARRNRTTMTIIQVIKKIFTKCVVTGLLFSSVFL